MVQGLAKTRSEESRRASAGTQMLLIPGGTFRMGSDRHYPEEAPVHRVTVDGFWMDRTPVTNRQFRDFVRATGHVTVAERRPDPKDYPGALPHMLYAGSLVFTPPDHPADLRFWGEWWTLMRGADWRHPYGPKSTHQRPRQPSRGARDLRGRARLRALGRQGPADRGRMGVCGPRRPRRRGVRLGRRVHARRAAHGEHLAGRLPAPEPRAGRVRAHLARSPPSRPTATASTT